MPDKRFHLVQPLITLSIGLVCFIGLSVSFAEPSKTDNLENTNQLFLRPVCPVAMQQEFEVMATIAGQNGFTGHSGASNSDVEGWFEGLEYKHLIMCLAKYESSFNPNAVGDNGNARGLLQFWRATFDRYCLGDYLSPRDQAVCCNSMLLADFGNTWHWTTANLCLSK